jgi:hypothetical protein
MAHILSALLLVTQLSLHIFNPLEVCGDPFWGGRGITASRSYIASGLTLGGRGGGALLIFGRRDDSMLLRCFARRAGEIILGQVTLKLNCWNIQTVVMLEEAFRTVSQTVFCEELGRNIEQLDSTIPDFDDIS